MGETPVERFLWRAKRGLSAYVGRIKTFIDRQTGNFKALLVTAVTTTSIRALTAGSAAQGGGGSSTGGASYQQLYLRALGANAQQLGLLNSVGSVANAVFALPLGWVSDRLSLRKVILAGLLLSVLVPTAFTLAATWLQAVPAMIMNQIMTVLLGMFTNVFYVTSVRRASDRATAMSLKSLLISVVGLVVPMMSAFVVSAFGGITVEGIRPLFLISLVTSVGVFLYALMSLKEVAFLQNKGMDQHNDGGSTKTRRLIQDYQEIARIPAVQKWTITKGLRAFFTNALVAFYSIYYVEVKGADPLIIGAMGTLSTLGALLFLIPFGRLADTHGRKKIIYFTRPFYYLSLVLAVFAPSQEYLLVASFVGALQTVSSLMEITMEHELVPADQRGRWGGFLFFFTAITGILGPLLVGYLWDAVNRPLLLITPIFADLPFLAILPTITDTLHVVHDQPSSQ